MNKKVAYCLFVVAFMLIWNLLDFLWAMLIAKSGYHFAVATDLAVPLVVSIVIGYLLFMRKKDE